MATPLWTLSPPLQNNKQWRLPNSQEKTLPWDGLNLRSNVPDQGVGVSPPQENPGLKDWPDNLLPNPSQDQGDWIL